MESNNCIINVGIGGWYPNGSRRLSKSLQDVGYNGDRLIYIDSLPPGAQQHEKRNYGFKAYAFKEAIERGYENIIWLDASVYAVRDPMPLFKHIQDVGYYFIHNGYNCAQTCTDRALKNMMLTRSEAEKMPEMTTCVFGINVNHCREFINDFILQESYGTFQGNRVHDKNDSKDSRFLFSRHDQSCASVLANQHGLMNWDKYGNFVQYKYDIESKENNLKQSTIFINWGHQYDS